MPTTARAQFPDITESSGHYKDAAAKAADCYGRGARALRKAQKQAAAGETEKARENYQRAKKEFSEAVGMQEGYFEALLGLGQAYLALGQKESALDACAHALAAKPKSAEAQACAESARGPANAG
ncbi:MAG TPA: tetratricopeptide repeat protein [Thermoanaerobaculia bacterium]|nr:tetratricopeptide repeat protein [Thermoanaerobaculia bacterium]